MAVAVAQLDIQPCLQHAATCQQDGVGKGGHRIITHQQEWLRMASTPGETGGGGCGVPAPGAAISAGCCGDSAGCGRRGISAPCTATFRRSTSRDSAALSQVDRSAITLSRPTASTASARRRRRPRAASGLLSAMVRRRMAWSASSKSSASVPSMLLLRPPCKQACAAASPQVNMMA